MKPICLLLVAAVAAVASGAPASAQTPDPFGSELAIDTFEIVEADESLVSGPLERGSRAYVLVAVTGMRPNRNDWIELTGDLALVAPDGKIDRRFENLVAYKGPLNAFERDDMRLELDPTGGPPAARLVFRPSFILPAPVATSAFVAQLTVQQGAELAEAAVQVTVAGIEGLKARAGDLWVEGIRIANGRDPEAPGGTRFKRGQPLYLHASVRGYRSESNGTVRLALDARLLHGDGRAEPRKRWVTLDQRLERVGMPLNLQVLMPLDPSLAPGAYRVELWVTDLPSQQTAHHSILFYLE